MIDKPRNQSFRKQASAGKIIRNILVLVLVIVLVIYLEGIV